MFKRASFFESSRIAEILRAETVGGMLVIAAALIAIVWANTPWSGAYDGLREFAVGPGSLHVHLSLRAWASDGLLAIFFFVAGLELKREFVAGDLKDRRQAALPVAAAVGGMLAPAGVYAVVNTVADGDLSGWAIPTATDIAFAVAVLAVIGTHLPSGLRTFMLALAVVDDLLAITVIAIFYTHELHLVWLVLALVPIAAFGVLVQRRVTSPWLLLPLAVVGWALVHASGVHATVAGVLLGFTVPVLRRDGADAKGLAEHLEHLVRPLSAGVAVPLFAFFAAGVHLGGWSGLGDALTDPIALGVVAGLVLGKPVGITAATWLLARYTHAQLDEELAWIDVLGMAMLGGIGFTVALLIGELGYGEGSAAADHVTIGVLVGSLLAAALASAVLRRRNRIYRRLCEEEAEGALAE